MQKNKHVVYANGVLSHVLERQVVVNQSRKFTKDCCETSTDYLLPIPRPRCYEAVVGGDATVPLEPGGCRTMSDVERLLRQ